MFSLFNKKARVKLLEERYRKLLEQSQKMISYNRKESERILAKANEVFQKIVRIKASV